jgi:hypothetical protein
VNYYATLVFFLIGILFFYVQLGWLGIIFILLGILVALYDPLSKGTKNAWNELDKAPSSYPEGKLEEYTKVFAKKGIEAITPKKHEKLKTEGIIQKTGPASKNFFSELKALFK